MVDSADDMLNKLCWMKATSGERFYPPKETAMECTESLIDGMDSPSISEQSRILYREVGEHNRAWTEAVDFFEALDTYGFDPVYRAEYYADQHDCSEPDWEWLKETSFDVNL